MIMPNQQGKKLEEGYCVDCCVNFMYIKEEGDQHNCVRYLNHRIKELEMVITNHILKHILKENSGE